MPFTILIMGLPGAGKTTLSRALATRLDAAHFNADEVRTRVSRDLGFSIEDRIEHARRMRGLCDQTTHAGRHAIADFVCPTEETRAAFGPAFIVWVDRIREGRYPDTNRLFVPPAKVDVHVAAQQTPEYWAGAIVRMLRPAIGPKFPFEAGFLASNVRNLASRSS